MGAHKRIGVYQAPEAPSYQVAQPASGCHASGAALADWLWGTSNDSALSHCDRASDTLPGSDLSVAADGHSDSHGDANPFAYNNLRSITDANQASDPDTNPNVNASPDFTMRPASWGPAGFFSRN